MRFWCIEIRYCFTTAARRFLSTSIAIYCTFDDIGIYDIDIYFEKFDEIRRILKALLENVIIIIHFGISLSVLMLKFFSLLRNSLLSSDHRTTIASHKTKMRSKWHYSIKASLGYCVTLFDVRRLFNYQQPLWGKIRRRYVFKKIQYAS